MLMCCVEMNRGLEDDWQESSAPEQHCFNLTLNFEVGLT